MGTLKKLSKQKVKDSFKKIRKLLQVSYSLTSLVQLRARCRIKNTQATKSKSFFRRQQLASTQYSEQ